MIDYLSATASRLWAVWSAGVPQWDTLVQPGMKLKRFTADATAKTRAAVDRGRSLLPIVDVVPRSFGVDGFAPNSPRSTFATVGASPGIGAAVCVLTKHSVAWDIRITAEPDRYGQIAGILIPMLAALEVSGSKFDLKPWGGGNPGPLAYVKGWTMTGGGFRDGGAADAPGKLEAVAPLAVAYQFTGSDLLT